MARSSLVSLLTGRAWRGGRAGPASGQARAACAIARSALRRTLARARLARLSHPPAPWLGGTHAPADELGDGELGTAALARPRPPSSHGRARAPAQRSGPPPCAAHLPRISWHARLGARADNVVGRWRWQGQRRSWGRARGVPLGRALANGLFFKPLFSAWRSFRRRRLPASLCPSPGVVTGRASHQPVWRSRLFPSPPSTPSRRSCLSRSRSPRRRAPSTRRPS